MFPHIWTADALSGEITLAATEIAEIAHLLGTLQDWLLHCDPLVVDDLAGFLPRTAGPEPARGFIDALGETGVMLIRLLGPITSPHTTPTTGEAP
jgi:hypothetical protein